MQERINLTYKRSTLETLDRYCCEALNEREIEAFAQKVIVVLLSLVDRAGRGKTGRFTFRRLQITIRKIRESETQELKTSLVSLVSVCYGAIT